MRQIRKLIIVGALLIAQNVTASGFARGIDVMTLNQYLGADLTQVLAAAAADPFDPLVFNNAVVAALKQVAANKTAERMDAQARLIAWRWPRIVALQEVFEFRCIDANPADDDACSVASIAGAFVDHLAKTLDALNGLYVDAATVVNLNLPPDGAPLPGIPFNIDGLDAFLTVKDRDVVLARHDIPTQAVPYNAFCAKPSEDGCNYNVVFGPFEIPLPSPSPPIKFSVERGFVGIDATVWGTTYRIVDTHLEVKDPPIPPVIQNAQALELLTVVGATPIDKTLVVLGDFNSSPDDLLVPDTTLGLLPPYAQFTALGYTDAWTLRRGNRPGSTCCQDTDLRNKKSALDQRIDIVFSREMPTRVKRARVLGATALSKTRPPGPRLWRSDHGAVAAKLQFSWKHGNDFEDEEY